MLCINLGHQSGVIPLADLQGEGQMPEDEVSHENDDAIESNLGGQQVPGPLLLHVRLLQG